MIASLAAAGEIQKSNRVPRWSRGPASLERGPDRLRDETRSNHGALTDDGRHD
ncbi:hypothetical protein ACFYO1_31670 [Nocardia sp. NPDC006044]|uniref:hypothetical protein n=1 Tax=Nocardia sp. NPDC006044 TaxID=3364306 RepID=UPI003679178A